MRTDFQKQETLPQFYPAAPQTPEMPKRIGPYKIESQLSKGGMSYLYLGRLPTAPLPIAIKVLSPSHLKNKEIAERFLKEAQIIGMTNHPNIVKLYGQGSWEKGLYIAMEFIRGVSLRQFIQQKSLSHKRALEIILQVAYALCHLHMHGVIHRDLKPENILITESGDVKVIDFGIAQLLEEKMQRNPSHATQLLGTPIYMSPEQKNNSQAATFASDIYSLGVIAYELILGRLSHGVIHLPLLPKPIREIVEKALKINQEERYQDIVDCITDISNYLKEIGGKPEEMEIQSSEETLKAIQHAQSLLIPQKAPRWQQIDLGLAIQSGISLNGLCLDFFSLSDNRYCIAMAEAEEKGGSSLFQCSIFRGMLRMAFSQAGWGGKKEVHPITVLSALNSALCSDPMRAKFSLSLVLLCPDRDQLSFASCNHGSLLHIPEGSTKARVLNTPNASLGSDPHAVLLETADNWHCGDKLILRTKCDDPIPDFTELLSLPPQKLSEQLLEKMHSEGKSYAKSARIAVALTRLF